MQELTKLKNMLALSVVKKPGESSASVAISKSGQEYLSGSIASDTNLLQISSEQAALTLSTLNKDYGVYKIITLTEQDPKTATSPIVLKILVDHSMRTNVQIEYKLIDGDGAVIFETKDVARELPFYKPEKIELSRTKKAIVEKNFLKLKISEPLELRDLAIKGLDRNFPLYDNASGYGTALTTKKGLVYFGGQYSSPDKRMNLHSEMAAVISALMNEDHEITSIGVVSSKYLDTPCDMCGVCRQFINEICAKFDLNPTLYAFAKESPVYKSYSIADYLPAAWSSKKWI